MTQTEAKRKLLMDQLQEWRRVHIKLEDRSQELDRSEESQFEAQRKKFSCHQCVLCQSSQQINGSKTEATLILCGSSGERANSCTLSIKCRENNSFVHSALFVTILVCKTIVFCPIPRPSTWSQPTRQQ